MELTLIPEGNYKRMTTVGKLYELGGGGGESMFTIETNLHIFQFLWK
jgi:hypothetical protein